MYNIVSQGRSAAVFVYDEENRVCVQILSHQYGDPRSYGWDIAKYLDGVTMRDMNRIANRMVVLMDDLTGGRSTLFPETVRGHGHDYEYHIFLDRVVIHNCNFTNRLIFAGSWKHFIDYCRDELFNNVD